MTNKHKTDKSCCGISLRFLSNVLNVMYMGEVGQGKETLYLPLRKQPTVDATIIVRVKYRLSLRTSQVAYQAGPYPSFCSMKVHGVLFLPPLWDLFTRPRLFERWITLPTG